MVHCGGHVSDQYLQVCEGAGYKFQHRPSSGDVLEIGPEYFKYAAGLVGRVGFMLTHTLWRKVLPQEGERANSELNDQIYSLLCAKRWKAAADLGTFSLSEQMLSGASDMQKRIRLVNTAIALKNLKQLNEMRALLASVDWTASIRDFRLAVRILEDDYERACALMREIGKRGELVHEVAYHQWPLFNAFREREEFHKTYESIFGYPFYLKAERSAEEARSKLESPKEGAAPASATDSSTAASPVKRRKARAVPIKVPSATDGTEQSPRRKMGASQT